MGKHTPLTEAIRHFLSVERFVTPEEAAADDGVCNSHLQAVWDAIAQAEAETAAAPLMAEALKEALGFLEDHRVTGDLPDTMRAALAAAGLAPDSKEDSR